ncbi:CPBP family intramembrane metalloprotease [Hellea sp.]|nr:CPBP family intramembrane metalloprotease [Hellea sp.]
MRTMLVIFVFYGVTTLIDYQLFPSDYEGMKFQTDMGVYFKLLIITLLLVPFQAASEEFLTRGYLNLALIKYLRWPWLVFIITSGGFAALHMGNPEAAGQMGPYLSSIFMFGMAMCVLLYFEGGIESAIGAHIANNIFVFALLGYEDPSLPNTAFFTLGEPVIEWSDFFIEFGMMSVLIALIIWANRKWGRSA